MTRTGYLEEEEDERQQSCQVESGGTGITDVQI